MPEPKGLLIVPVGFRSDGTLRALELTDDDELKVYINSSTLDDILTELEAKLETADLELVSKILSIGSHGWLDGAWQRNPLQLGYSDIGGNTVTLAAPSTAGFSITDSVVPAGEIWLLQFGSVMNSVRASQMQFQPSVGGAYCVVVEGTTSGAWLNLPWTGQLIMQAGDAASGYFRTGHQAGDTCYLQYSYVRIDIDQ